MGKDNTEFSTIKDNRGLRDGLHDSLVHYEEVNGGKTTFLIGKDMTYFKKGVLDLLATFHPVDSFKKASSIDEYRPQAKIQMSGHKYLAMKDSDSSEKLKMKEL